MSKFENKVAVITGAGSGIGKQLALALVARGARVAISDINATALQETKAEIDQKGGLNHAITLDVSDREAVYAYADLIENELGSINLVINNAGVALSTGSLQNTLIDEFEWLMGINFSGVLYGTKAFLPKLEKSDWGHIVNISSLFGLIGVPEQAAYNASKFAVRGLTEALRQELEQMDSHISCTSVHPGGIATNIARNARPSENLDSEGKAIIEQQVKQFDKVARTTAVSAAQQILRAVEKNQRRLLIGKDAKLMDWIQRHFPNHYQKVLQYLMKWPQHE